VVGISRPSVPEPGRYDHATEPPARIPAIGPAEGRLDIEG
jgi:hypothetical protein